LRRWLDLSMTRASRWVLTVLARRPVDTSFIYGCRRQTSGNELSCAEVTLAEPEPRTEAGAIHLGGYALAETALDRPERTEGMDRQPALDLFDAFGTKEKTLHANLGGHAGTPWFEVDDGPGSSPGI